MKLMFHDDSCGEFLDAEGKCPKCRFHPDTQSTAFRDVQDGELCRGRSYLGPNRVPVYR